MIRVPSKPGFSARQVLEMSFRRLCAAFLQALAQGMIALAGLLNWLTTEGLTIRRGSQVNDPQVNAERLSRFIRRWSGTLKGHSQIPCPMTVDEVSLHFESIQSSLLIATDPEGNEETTGKGQEGNSSESLEGHDALIIGDSPFWPEVRLDALIALIGFTGLANGTNSQLSGQLIGGTQLTIHQLLQGKLIGGLFAKSDCRYRVGRCIKRMHGVKQSLMLFWCWSKLQDHRLFHRESIKLLMRIVNIIREVGGMTACPCHCAHVT